MCEDRTTYKRRNQIQGINHGGVRTRASNQRHSNACKRVEDLTSWIKPFLEANNPWSRGGHTILANMQLFRGSWGGLGNGVRGSGHKEGNGGKESDDETLGIHSN